MPTLNAVIDTTEGLNEAFTEYYQLGSDGRYHVQLENYRELDIIQPLKNAHERIKSSFNEMKTENAELKSKLQSLPEDFDPVKWEKIKDGKPDEAALISLRQQLEAERDEWKGKYEAASQSARDYALDRDLTDALAQSGVTKPTFITAARKMLADGVQIGENGKPYVDTDMGPVGLAEHVKRWAASDGKDFVTAPQGGGSKGGGDNGAVKTFSQMNSAEKTELYRSDRNEYERLKTAET